MVYVFTICFGAAAKTRPGTCDVAAVDGTAEGPICTARDVQDVEGSI